MRRTLSSHDVKFERFKSPEFESRVGEYALLDDIELIAKKNLSSAAIEKITRNNLHGPALKNYIKLKKW